MIKSFLKLIQRQKISACKGSDVYYFYNSHLKLESWKPKLLVYLPHLECAIYEKLNWIHGHVGPLASFAMFYPLPLHGLKELGISKTSYVVENFLDPQNYEVKKALISGEKS